jgi:hypothetical protein
MILETALGIAVLARMVAVLAVAVLGVRVTKTSGDPIDGDLQSVGKSALVVEVDGSEQEIAFEDLVSVVPIDRVEDVTGPPMRVTLLSGSRIAAQDMVLADEQLRIEPRRQQPLTVPLKEVKSIRFRAAAAVTDPQWLGLLENEDRRDLLAIRREGNQIDPAPVVVESISGGPESKVGFSIGGESGAAPIERLEGIVLGGNRQVIEEADIQVADIYGSKWSVQSVALSGEGKLRLNLSDSITHEVPLEQLDSLSWKSGLVMLASIDPAETFYQPYVKTNLDDSVLAKWHGPAAAPPDLLMVGGSAIEYRIDPGFATVAGSVRRDQQVAKAGNVSIVITLDGQAVWDESLTDSEARGFEIPLKGARRLRIDVKSGDDGDVGDTVRVLRPRLLK